ncbi:excinuclease ABC subunit UvrC [Saxibacter everestensis]|uniref:UvrABC system protein C n=1 Tax=Saxibacter everestensis TaxID=2909229 RepID=A0ABY8QZG3_9MICO|nr:excinuclease ABC subunit UvrC [Brevibacteriaceae bacterium ZFBP1038]
MADPQTYRPKTGEIPNLPGVYRFRDSHRRVIYVGKAKNLRSRLTSYFANLAGMHPRTQSMVTTAASVEWTVVSSEVEALQLEYTWIKEFEPRFNVKFRDDKSYPYLAVTLGDEFPRAQVMRGAKKKGVKYFGPYTHVWAIRETLDLLLRVFPIRTCSPGVFKRAQRANRPCLLGYIDKCAAPCVGRISPEDHRTLADDFSAFMGGQTGKFIGQLERRMKEAAAELDFEGAARLRDDLDALKKVLNKSAVVLNDSTDADIFAVADDELEAAVQVFHVRQGRIRGQRGWVVERVEDASPAELVEHLLQQVYGEAEAESIPREVLVPHLPPDANEVVAWLSQRRGAKVDIRIPQRGDKRNLMETVEQNAKHALVLHKTRRAGDLTNRSQALQEIQEALGLDDAPLRIECFDVSHTQGSNVVASMVVFEDGMARKSEYRRFIVRNEAARDDTASMYDVLSRRFSRYLENEQNVMAAEADAETRAAELASEQSTADSSDAGSAADDSASGISRVAIAAAAVEEIDSPAERGMAKRFAYPPNLLVVDGGPPQVAAAVRALSDLGITDVAICGLAKRLEEVWVPDDEFPLILPRGSEGLYLLQRLRDEAHRFAISFHRKRRSTAMTRSSLDDVPGLGASRQKALLKHFGSVKKIRAATPEAITAVEGIGPKLAEAISVALRSDTAEANDAIDPNDTANPAETAGPNSTAEPDDTANSADTAEANGHVDPNSTAEPDDTADAASPADTVEANDAIDPNDTANPAETAGPSNKPQVTNTARASNTAQAG